jgi:hypothetical protein
MRKPHDTTHISLRLREELRRRLEQSAAQRRLTLTSEIRIRLEDSLDIEPESDLRAIVDDLKINWLRYSARHLRIDLADQLADVLAKNEDLKKIDNEDTKKIRTLTRLIIEHRATEQRPSDVP